MSTMNLYFKDKILNCLGDSTTWGDNGIESGGNNISWTTHLQDILPFKTVRNYGVRASRVAITPDRTDSFIERYDDMEKDADIVTVFGGINDFQHNVPLGTIEDQDPHSFYGALNTLIKGVVSMYPTQPIIFMTPTKNNFKHPTKRYPTTLQANKLGLFQRDYVQAMVRSCDLYSVPVIDLYTESGISPFLPEYVPKYMPDGMHYSDAGYERLSHRIAGELLRLAY